MYIVIYMVMYIFIDDLQLWLRKMINKDGGLHKIHVDTGIITKDVYRKLVRDKLDLERNVVG